MPATGTLQSITPDAPDLNGRGRGRGHGPLLQESRPHIWHTAQRIPPLVLCGPRALRRATDGDRPRSA